MIPYSKQIIDSKDIQAIKKVLEGKIITQGLQVLNFEKKISKLVNAKFAVASNSATSSLHVACMALNLSKNDYIWTVPNTFVASANCGLYCGAKVDFVDIDENTFNLCINKLKEKLIIAKSKKKLPKIFIGVDFAGNPYDHEGVYKLLKKYNIKVISDSSHSLGAKINSYKVGSCKWTDISVFSFHPVKIITTAEGGVAVTNNKKIYEKMKLFMNHGIERNYFKLNKKIKSPWYYEQKLLGFNYRMNEMQAALGISQLKKLNKFHSARNILANRYKKQFKKLPIKFQLIKKNYKSSYHLFVIIFPSQIIKRNLYDKIYKYYRKNKIGVNLHYLPVHLHPLYKKLGFKAGNFPKSENYSRRAMSLPLYPSLSFQMQDKIIRVTKKISKIYFEND